MYEKISTLLYAAYSVAVSASDAEYFAEICRDLAQSLQSEAGRTACEAQDEVRCMIYRFTPLHYIPCDNRIDNHSIHTKIMSCRVPCNELLSR